MTRKVCSIFLVFILCLSLLPAGAFAAEDVPTAPQIHVVANQEEFMAALERAQAGDTIQLGSTVVLQSPEGGSEPLVIDKEVTIQGGTLCVRYGGILLGADVAFTNVILEFPNPTRSAILANGHSLTLENVQYADSGYPVHLFCGGLTGSGQEPLPTPGSHGQIILKGNTKVGNLYAGSLSSDGETNSFDKPATIAVSDSAEGTIGTVYASGASENAAATPPTASAARFPVTGAVKIYLYGDLVQCVDGSTGGTADAAVIYQGGRYMTENVVLANIANLSVENGTLVPGAGSSFSGTDASVSLKEDTTLGLNNYGNVVIGDFEGGTDGTSSLTLAANQTLTITGAITGTTAVGIGAIDATQNTSTKQAALGHTYIKTAAGSVDGTFVLLPYGDDTNIELAFDENYGAWIAAVTPMESVSALVESFMLASGTVSSSESNVKLPLNPTFAGNSLEGLLYMDNIPLTITVNGIAATPAEGEDGGYTYTVDGLSLEVIGNKLFIMLVGNNPNLPDTYTISVTVPAEYSASGEALTSSATLTVAAEDSQSIEIPVPQAIDGLKYTRRQQIGVPAGIGYTITDNTETDVGQHSAIATLETGYVWEGSNNPNETKTIPWTIEKADGPAAPAGLTAVAPSADGVNDGKIIGTTDKMEYATNKSFSESKDCETGTTTDLSAGTYYVRVKNTDTTNYENGQATEVVIPTSAPTVQSIAVSSTGHKTQYQKDEALDVTGMTLTVTMSDNSTRTAAVTDAMVSGFDPSQAGDQTLTITYSGKATIYVVTVDETAAFPSYTLTVSGSYAAATGAGSYKTGATVQVSAGTRSGYTFSGWTASGITLDDSQSPDLLFAMPAGDVTLTANWSSNSGGSGSSAPTYQPNVPQPSQGGQVAVSPANPKKGDRVTVTPKADQGYEVDEITVTGPGGSPVPVTKNSDGTFSFTQPAGRVTVEVTYKPTETPGTTPFPDVSEGAWYAGAVTFVQEHGLMNGHENGRFAPEDTLTRAELAQILYNSEGQPAVGQGDFSDVAAGDWYANAVSWAAASGVVNGMTPTTYAPNTPISREQLATMLYRYAQAKGWDTTQGGMAIREFDDCESISDYAEAAMTWAVEAGVLQGYENKTLRPQATATRAEAAQMLMNFLQSN